jgi:molybdopterin synthase catalytic subunit
MFSVRIQEEDFDIARDAEAALGAGAGALVVFTGYCRDEVGTLVALRIEHYPGMAEIEIEATLTQARARWPLLGAVIRHRFGDIAVGDKIVLVAVAARHRREAFEAAEFLMDYLKSRAPFWKRERRADGRLGEWVDAREEDEGALARWTSQTSF